MLSFREHYPDTVIDLLIPFDGWIDDQPDSARYKQITVQAESINYSCEEAYEESIDVCNTLLIGFGRCTVFIHDNGDNTMQEMAGESRNAGQEVKEIII